MPTWLCLFCIKNLQRMILANEKIKILDQIDYGGMNVYLTLNKGKSICIQLQINVKWYCYRKEVGVHGWDSPSSTITVFLLWWFSLVKSWSKTKKNLPRGPWGGAWYSGYLPIRYFRQVLHLINFFGGVVSFLIPPALLGVPEVWLPVWQTYSLSSLTFNEGDQQKHHFIYIIFNCIKAINKGAYYSILSVWKGGKGEGK